MNESDFIIAWSNVEKDIKEHLNKVSAVVFESLGIFTPFKDFLSKLKSSYNVILISVQASPELCLKRIAEIDASDHVNFKKENLCYIIKLSNINTRLKIW